MVLQALKGIVEEAGRRGEAPRDREASQLHHLNSITAIQIEIILSPVS